MIIDLQGQWAWHSIFEINFVNFRHIDSLVPTLVSLALIIADISTFKRIDRQTRINELDFLHLTEIYILLIIANTCTK